MMFYITNRYFKICCVGEVTFSYKIREVELSMLCYVKELDELQLYNSKITFPRNVLYIQKNTETQCLLSILVFGSVKTLFSELSCVSPFYFLIF